MTVLAVLLIFVNHNSEENKMNVLVCGIFGIIAFLMTDGVSRLLEKPEAKSQENLSQGLAHNAAKTGLISFLYLELTDASFSLDGVLKAFAISKDIIIITIGLATGAMFVRSLTIFMVEKNTLKQYIYLEHGAHYAIGFLSFVMLLNTIKEVPKTVTGLTGLIIAEAAFISSITKNKKNLQK